MCVHSVTTLDRFKMHECMNIQWSRITSTITGHAYACLALWARCVRKEIIAFRVRVRCNRYNCNEQNVFK